MNIGFPKGLFLLVNNGDGYTKCSRCCQYVYIQPGPSFPFLGLAPQDIYHRNLNPVLKAIHQLKQAFNFLNTRRTVIYLTSPLCLLPRLLFLRPACPRKAGDLGPPNIPHAGGQHSYPSPSPEHPTTPESARLAHSQHLGPAYRRNKENIHLFAVPYQPGMEMGMTCRGEFIS